MSATEAELFAAHLEDAVGFATGCFRIPGMSRDEIAQTARLALWEAAVRWRGPSSCFAEFGPYARAVVRNRLRTQFTSAVRRIRREALAETTAPVFCTVPDADADARELAERQSDREQITAALGRLTGRHAQTARAWLASPALADIADALGLHSIQHAHTVRNQAFAALRAALVA